MCTECSYFSSAIALFNALMETVFAAIIGFGGASPLLCQFYHSSAKISHTDVNFSDIFGKLAGLLALITWIWIMIL